MVSRAPLENHDLRFPKRQHLPSGGWACIQNPQVLGATQLSLAWRCEERRGSGGGGGLLPGTPKCKVRGGVSL